MTLNETIEIKVNERISEFHYYLKEGLSVAQAKEIILSSTTLNEVKSYVNNYVSYHYCV